MARLSLTSVVAGTATAAVAVGGGAFAFITASGAGEDAGQLTQLSEEERTLTLELWDDSEVGSDDVFEEDGAKIRVKGTNSGPAPLELTDATILLPVLDLPDGCPDGSFEVGDEKLKEGSVPPGGSLQIGSFRLTFINSETEVQDGCFFDGDGNPVSIGFIWGTPAT
jgi:hypothetical protein